MNDTERLAEALATIERLKVDLETKSVVHLCCEIVERVKVLHRESDSGGWCISQEGGSNEIWPCPTARAMATGDR